VSGEWFSTVVLEQIERWAAANPGSLIWTGGFTELGAELSRRNGWPYYGEKGTDATGRSITSHPKSNIALSSDCNRQGYDLQHIFHRALILDPPGNGAALEQQLGRLPRPGQTLPVHTTIFLACYENVMALRNCFLDSPGAITPRLLDHSGLARPDKAPGSGPVWDPRPQQLG